MIQDRLHHNYPDPTPAQLSTDRDHSEAEPFSRPIVFATSHVMPYRVRQTFLSKLVFAPPHLRYLRKAPVQAHGPCRMRYLSSGSHTQEMAVND